MLHSIVIPNGPMAAVSSKLCNLNSRNEHLNPINKHINPRNEYFNPKNALQRPLQMQLPFISNRRFGKTISHHFCCNFNAFSKPIDCPRRMPYCHVAESEAYVAEPFDKEDEEEEEDFSDKQQELKSTLRLVECAMFSAIVGLAYFLSSTLRIENYFGYFFPLPLVISSMRWGVVAGRKTMVSTAILLLIISGPLKAASYLLMHGFVGFAMGALWRLELNWGLSIIICTLVRSIGALGFILLSSWLLRENILSLIMINAHASVSYMFAAVGINVIPSMKLIHAVFVSLLLMNCGSFVFLLHVLYAIFIRRLGIKTSMSLPGWLERVL